MGKVKKTKKKPRNVHILQRTHQAEVKKKLRRFAESEYKAKKPLELRLLQLKPQIVFKKGTVLPNLLIKALSRTSFVIYLDYGAELRFYFYTKDGISMGASNFPKTEKMINEMHGKAKTLTCYPKKDPNALIDTESIQFQQHFKKWARRIGQKYALSFKNLPTFAVKTKIPHAKQIRSGLDEHGQIYHIDREYITKEIRDQIILREIFLLSIPKSSPKAAISLLATLWALTESPSEQKTEIEKLIPSWMYNTPLTIKFHRWITQRFTPQLSENLQIKQTYSLYLHELAQVLDKSTSLPMIQMYESVLVWIMKHSAHCISDFDPNEAPIIKKSWILYHLLTYINVESPLLAKYNIKVASINREIFSYYLLAAYSILKSLNLISKGKEISSPSDMGASFVNFEKNQGLLENLELREFVENLPSIITSHQDILHYIYVMIEMLFVHKGCVLQSPPDISLKRNSQVELPFHLHNQSNWILYNPKYILETNPGSTIAAKIVKHPNTVVFDTQVKFAIKISASDRSKSSLLKIFCEFDDYDSKDRRRTLQLADINLKIENEKKD